MLQNKKQKLRLFKDEAYLLKKIYNTISKANITNKKLKKT